MRPNHCLVQYSRDKFLVRIKFRASISLRSVDEVDSPQLFEFARVIIGQVIAAAPAHPAFLRSDCDDLLSMLDQAHSRALLC